MNSLLTLIIFRSLGPKSNLSTIWKLCRAVRDPVTNTKLAICNLCNHKCDVTKNTTNCRKHLKSSHALEFKKAENGSDNDDSATSSATETDVDAVSEPHITAIFKEIFQTIRNSMFLKFVIRKLYLQELNQLMLIS